MRWHAIPTRVADLHRAAAATNVTGARAETAMDKKAFV